MYDLVLLTDSRFTADYILDEYSENVILEDGLLMCALADKGLNVHKTHWNDVHMDWSQTRTAIIRTTWDIYEDGNFSKFEQWLENVKSQTQLINEYSTVRWNLDKHYLIELNEKGIQIPPTIFIEKGDTRSLNEVLTTSKWQNPILKPAISGGGRHTYKLDNNDISEISPVYAQLIQEESMLLQEFQHNVVRKGELTLMVFGGKYSHAVLKKAKPGDFRVQDDFGGTVHPYSPSPEEIAFAEKVVSVCDPTPLQARVDFIWDNNEALCVSELELIEPELWFRNKSGSADQLAELIVKKYFG
ncbi:MAG: hypothetical protein ABJF11_00830 [Reichenbachiella sp.]|uniref:ATP-grasp domain-containing protein n=1 Tax=Reichenbachiella sp. TaxID=2184521 RepID=UPI003262F7A4